MPTGRGFDPPAEVRDQVDFHWFHVPQTGSLVLCVLSGEPLWYVGHFSQGRMVRCAGDGCRACAEGFGKQLRYVLSCADVSSGQVGVLEFGKPVALALADRARARGSLRGMVVELYRAARSKHARVEVSVLDREAPHAVSELFGLDLVLVLDRTWSRQEAGVYQKARSEVEPRAHR